MISNTRRGGDQEEKPWPERLDLSNIDTGLLKFCLSHGFTSQPSEGIAPRDPADYKWLREAFESLEDDAKVMARLIGQMREPGVSADDIVDALEQLQELVENVDNANDLPKLGAVPALKGLLTHQSPSVQGAVAGVFQAMAANNPPGQLTLVAAGVVSELVKVVSGTNSEAAGRAAIALATCVDCCPKAAESLEQAESGKGLDAVVKLIATEALGNKRACMRGAVLLRNLARSSEQQRRVLRERGALSVLLGAITSPATDLSSGTDVTMREKACEALLALATPQGPEGDLARSVLASQGKEAVVSLNKLVALCASESFQTLADLLREVCRLFN